MDKIATVPRGLRSLTPHILCASVDDAVALYQLAFGAIVVSTQAHPATDASVFAHLKIGNSALTLSQGQSTHGSALSLHFYVEDFDASWASAIDAGCAELSAPQTAYWGDRLGVLIDPFGVHWTIAQRIERVSVDERTRRAAEQFEATTA